MYQESEMCATRPSGKPYFCTAMILVSFFITNGGMYSPVTLKD